MTSSRCFLAIAAKFYQVFEIRGIAGLTPFLCCDPVSVLISAVETVFGISGDKFCGPEKNAKAVLAKEVLILVGREQGAGVNELSLIAGLDTSNISRRCDAARIKVQTDRKLAYAKAQAEKIYHANIAESQT